jgi:hypothetical protein
MSRREASDISLAPYAVAPLRSFHTAIFDARGRDRLIRIDVPYWFARRFARTGEFRWLGELTFLDDIEFDPSPFVCRSINSSDEVPVSSRTIGIQPVASSSRGSISAENTMTAHLLVHPEKRPVRRANELFRLDWRAYWLVVGVLGGILALAGVVLLASFSFR